MLTSTEHGSPASCVWCFWGSDLGTRHHSYPLFFWHPGGTDSSYYSYSSGGGFTVSWTRWKALHFTGGGSAKSAAACASQCGLSTCDAGTSQVTTGARGPSYTGPPTDFCTFSDGPWESAPPPPPCVDSKSSGVMGQACSKVGSYCTDPMFSKVLAKNCPKTCGTCGAAAKASGAATGAPIGA